MRRSVIITVSLISAVAFLAPTLLAQGPDPREPGQFPTDVMQASQSSTQLAQSGSRSLVDRLKAIRGEVTSEHSNSGTAAAPRAVGAAPVTEPDHTSSLRSVLKRRGASQGAPIVEPEAPRETMQVSPGPVSPLNAAPITEPADDSSPAEIDSSRRTARRPRRSMPTFSPALVHNSDSTSGQQLTLSTQGPAMRVETEGPKTIAVGKPANYRVRLVNQSDDDAGNVVVYVTVPSGVDLSSADARLGDAQIQQDSDGNPRVAWKMERVAGRSQHELAVTLQPRDNRPIELRVDWAFRPASLTAQIEVQQPQLAVNIQGPTDVQYGEAKVFKIQLSNPGNGPAENVVVNLNATGAAEQPSTIGTIAAGETREMEIELTARQAGIMKIDAVAQGDGGLQASSALEVMVRRAELAIDVRAPEMVFAGTDTSYTIHVTNRGDATAKGVILSLNLPQGIKDGVGIDQKPMTSAQPRWRLGDLTPGTERVFTLQCQLTSGGQNRLTANANGEGDVKASGVVTTMVEAIADLKLYVNDPKGPVPVGQDVVYEVKVINRGSKAANDIELVAQFSDGIEPTQVTGHRSEIVPGQVLFDTIRSLPAGGEMTLKITARAAKDGNLRFRAELTCADSDTKLVSEENTRFYAKSSGATSQTAGNQGEPTPARR
jgi:hypothetical protein